MREAPGGPSQAEGAEAAAGPASKGQVGSGEVGEVGLDSGPLGQRDDWLFLRGG